MPRNITVTFDDGSTHVYQNAPDDVTPERVTERASKEFGKQVSALDGGRQAPPTAVGVPELLARPQETPESRRSAFEARFQREAAAEKQRLYDDLSFGEKLLVGAGKSAEDVLLAGKQGLTALAKLATPGYGSEIIDRRLQDLQREAGTAEQAYQAATPGGTTAGAGRILGTVAATAVPANAAVRASQAGSITSPLLRAITTAGVGGGAAATMAPVGEGDFLLEKMKQAGVGAATSAALGGSLFGLSRLAKTALSPRATMLNASAQPVGLQRILMGTPDESFAKESDALFTRTGVTAATPGMRTGAKVATAMENAARQNAFTADKMLERDRVIAEQTTKYIEKVMNAVRARPESAESAGVAAQNALRNATKKMIDERSAVASKMYGELRKSGVKIQYSNLADELQKIIDEADGALDDTSQKAAAGASRMLADITGKTTTPASAIVDASGQPLVAATKEAGARTFDMTKALRSRAGFSQAAAGTGNVFADLESAASRKYGMRLRDALEADFAAAEGADASGMLKAANAAYRAHSQRIDQVKKTYLARLLGQDLANGIDDLTMGTVAPESVTEKILRLKPSEARQLKGFLGKHDADAVSAIRRVMLQNAYDKMFNQAASAGAKPLPNLNAFVQEIRKNQSINQWFSKEELAKIDDAAQLIRRFGDKFGYNFSGTAAQSALLEMIKPGMDRLAQMALLNKIAQGQGPQPYKTPSLGRAAPAAQALRQSAATAAGALTAAPDEEQ